MENDLVILISKRCPGEGAREPARFSSKSYLATLPDLPRIPDCLIFVKRGGPPDLPRFHGPRRFEGSGSQGNPDSILRYLPELL